MGSKIKMVTDIVCYRLDFRKTCKFTYNRIVAGFLFVLILFKGIYVPVHTHMSYVPHVCAGPSGQRTLDPWNWDAVNSLSNPFCVLRQGLI